MPQYNKIVIIGATSAIAEQCARLWLSNAPQEMILVGRDLARLDLLAADLRVRTPATTITTVTTDFQDGAKIAGFAQDCMTGTPPDLVLIAHGALPDQLACQSDLTLCAEVLGVNGVSPVLFAEAFVERMVTEDKGTIAIIGSVAGDRGRKSNYVYGAAKGLVERYAQGLQHRLAKSAVQIVLIKPGPTDTPMTAHLKKDGAKLSPVQAVAQTMVDGIERGKAVIYVPGKWALIMFVIRNLPNTIFGRMDV
jgi:decaprenylphospho-beta-D-erythro-pentofuranosid-2-ulose 2-reductase